MGDGQVTWIRGRCGGPGRSGIGLRGACAAGSPARGRRPRCRCPVRLLVAQPTIWRENRPRDEGGAAEPRPGRHAGEVDHPAPVWAGGGGSPRRVRAERGPGSPWRARWCAPSCPARRRPDSGARMRRTRGACGPPRGPPAGSPAAAGSSRKSPAPASKRLGPPGARIPSRPRGGVRDRPLRRRAGPGGVSQVDGAGPAPPTRSGRRRPGTGPAAPPLRPSMHLVDQWQGRSHSAAMTSRRAPPDRPLPPPARGPPDAGSPVRRASPVVVPGRSPATAPDPGRIPAAQGLGALPQPLRPHAANTPQADPGRPRRPGVNRIARRPRSSGYFPGAGTVPHPFHEFKPSTTPRAIQSWSKTPTMPLPVPTAPRGRRAGTRGNCHHTTRRTPGRGG